MESVGITGCAVVLAEGLSHIEGTSASIRAGVGREVKAEVARTGSAAHISRRNFPPKH